MNRTTVAIPLHASAPWAASVAGNIARLLDCADVVVSDASGIDDTLDRLRRDIPERPGLRYVEPVAVGSGWVAHCNHLLSEARTPYFMWLPHDDEIGADWVRRSEETLEQQPKAILATGSIVALDRPDSAPYPSRITLTERFAAPDRSERVLSGVRAAVYGDTSQLGLVFRSVFRRDLACPLPTDPPGGEWADILWAIRMLVRGYFADVPGAEYGKRWHPENTHSAWRDLRLDPAFRARWLPQSIAELPAISAASVLGECWSEEVETLTGTVEEVQEFRESQLVDMRRSYESSWSWRLGAPGRVVTRFVRGLLRLRRGPRAQS
jgi:hypothetical protein